jgi:hypothetical protein
MAEMARSRELGIALNNLQELNEEMKRVILLKDRDILNWKQECMYPLIVFEEYEL